MPERSWLSRIGATAKSRSTLCPQNLQPWLCSSGLRRHRGLSCQGFGAPGERPAAAPQFCPQSLLGRSCIAQNTIFNSSSRHNVYSGAACSNTEQLQNVTVVVLLFTTFTVIANWTSTRYGCQSCSCSWSW